MGAFPATAQRLVDLKTGRITVPWAQYLSNLSSSSGAVSNLLINVKDYGAVGNGSHDDTAAFNAALATGEVAFVPAGTYVISSTLEMAAGGGLVGVGQTSVIQRAFNGGALIRWSGGTGAVLGQTVTLRGLLITTAAGTTAIAGDTGLDLGYAGGAVAQWEEEGVIDDLYITGQWNGMHIKGGTLGAVSRVTAVSNLNHGFYLENARGLLFYCFALTNSGNGFDYICTDNSQPGFDFEQCSTFLNNGYGFLLESSDNTNPAKTIFDLNMIGGGCSSDGLGGIVSTCSLNQCHFTHVYVEGAGVAVANTKAPGIRIDGGPVSCSEVTLTAVQSKQNNGNGIEIGNVINLQAHGIYCTQNGRGGAGAAWQRGLSIESTARKVQVYGFDYGFRPGGDPQLSDVTIAAAAVTGSFSGNYQNITNASASFLVSNKAPASFTSTITAGAGTITSATGTLSYNIIDGRIVGDLRIVITTNGTGSGSVKATLPFVSAQEGSTSGTKNNDGTALTGLLGAGSSQISIFKYDATYPGADGVVLNVKIDYPINAM